MITAPTYYEESLTGFLKKDTLSTLLSSRIILLFDQITDDTAGYVISQLLVLEAQNPDKDIQIYINSPGGSVSAGLAIFDVMKHIKCDVATTCVGQACSMGAFLLAAGAKGKRRALKHSSIMIHQVLGAIPLTQTSDIEIQAANMSKTKELINRLMASSTGRSEREIDQACERDYYMNANQAIKFGIIDEVI